MVTTKDPLGLYCCAHYKMKHGAAGASAVGDAGGAGGAGTVPTVAAMLAVPGMEQRMREIHDLVGALRVALSQVLDESTLADSANVGPCAEKSHPGSKSALPATPASNTDEQKRK